MLLCAVPGQDDDSVIDCIFNDQTGIVVIQASHDIGHSNEVLSNVRQLSQYLGTGRGVLQLITLTCMLPSHILTNTIINCNLNYESSCLIDEI